MEQQPDRLLHDPELTRTLDIDLHDHLFLELVVGVHSNLPLVPVKHHDLVAGFLLGGEDLRGLERVDFELIQQVQLRNVIQLAFVVLGASEVDHEGIEGLLGRTVDREVGRRAEVVEVLLQGEQVVGVLGVAGVREGHLILKPQVTLKSKYAIISRVDF